jgi:hypothetical protein
MPDVPYVRLPTELPARYAHGPDSFPQPGVSRGRLDEYEWAASRVFPGTSRRYWIYVPAQYGDDRPAAFMVFQDAAWYMDLDSEVRAPVVLDNLIHKGEIPATVVVFVEPSEDRNAEYDAFDDVYATFLLEELIPAVRARLRSRTMPIGGPSPVAAAAGTARSPPHGFVPTDFGGCTARPAASCRCRVETPIPS